MTRRGPQEWAATAPCATPPALEVLIPTRHRPAELAATLAGLAAQDAEDFGVIVSDQSDGSPDWAHPAAEAMLRVLEAQGRAVRVQQHRPPRGLAEHRQTLLEASSAPRILFLDDDVWLAPSAVRTLDQALVTLGCGFVGMAVQGLSYLDDRRPDEVREFSLWDGPVQPEHLDRGTPGFERWRLHNAANLAHLAADLSKEGRLQPGEWLPYRVAWIGGCVLYRRDALEVCGGFGFWRDLPPGHSGEDVVAQWRVMERFGGAGIIPSQAVHLESPTTVTDRSAEASEVLAEGAARSDV
ncbi:glycosyltransferase family A protein [Sinomonas notoginsengisoli]|uniref:glycosyltransferase family A protein n=1 Tax=Sinomonas notoginsengisoli TaxID=1457311 RepID=UPI001F2872EC|nr:glycosyltransferase family A protein [Sinomonas notoginsengisoli]